MTTLTAVDHDPFSQYASGGQKLVPVDHDPFAKTTLTPVDHNPFGEDEQPSYLESVKQDYANMDADQQKIADQVASGKVNEKLGLVGQSLAETRLMTSPVNEAISRIPMIGDALKSVGGAVVRGARALPTVAGSSSPTMGGLYDQTMQNNPNLAVGVHAVGDALSAATMPSIGNSLANGVKAVAPELPSMAKDLFTPTEEEVAATAEKAAQAEAAKSMAAKVADAPKTTADWAKDAGESYDYANYRNEKFANTDVTDPFVSKLQQAKAELLPNGVQTPEQGELNKFIDNLSGMKGAPISLSQVDTLDKALADKIAAHTDSTGAMDSTANTLNGLKKDLRSLVMGVPTEGNAALHNGRVAWSTRSALRDLDIAEDNADVAGGTDKHYMSQYRRLYKDRDNTGLWPQAARDALYKAAKPTLADKLVNSVTTHGAAAIAGVTGHFGAAGVIEAGKAGLDDLKGSWALTKGEDIRQALIEDAVGKMKDVDYTPPAQLQLPPPDGSAAFAKPFQEPLTDSGVSIAQKLANKPLPTTNETPINQPEGQVATPQNIAGRLKDWANNGETTPTRSKLRLKKGK